MKSTTTAVVKRLLLVGGGHSHLSVLRRLAMRPVAGLETVLVTRDVLTPYSGALPGFLAGRYRLQDIHIDLRRLAQFAGARIIQAEVTGINLESRRLQLPDRPPMGFDILSLNIGSRPDAKIIPGASTHAVAVKPIDTFLDSWATVAPAAITRVGAGEPYTIAIVGGGPASVEIAFAMEEKIRRELGRKKPGEPLLRIRIITADTRLLSSHNSRVQAMVADRLAERGIEVLTDRRVSAFRDQCVDCEGGESHGADVIYYATGASVPDWPGETGLQVDDRGFIAVNDHLQSLSHPFVFAAGDAASMVSHSRPKSGVYAVRQGKPLSENLVRYATGRRLVSYRPQKRALALLYSGDGCAIASRDKLFLQGRWVWEWKHRIDQAFLHKYGKFPEPGASLKLAPGITDKDTARSLRAQAMRCTGCGAKVGAGTLHGVLQGLPIHPQEDVLSQNGVEDAALIRLDDQRTLMQSVDLLPAMINDPWLFARIATNHCLSDIYAMGCDPHSALAVVGIPFASRRFMSENLNELMAGAAEELRRHRTMLIGGHSTETPQLLFGLSVNGFLMSRKVLHKSHLQPGDVLILTKSLGTGTLLAADNRYRAAGDWMTSAINTMLQSGREAAACLREHDASACTDITGFGLAGHLLEMLQPRGLGAELTLDHLPALEGALECLKAGIFSSLHEDNRTAELAIAGAEAFRQHGRYHLLFDPQTAGGLLAGVPAANAPGCLAALHQLGYHNAAIIGRVTAAPVDASISLI